MNIGKWKRRVKIFYESSAHVLEKQINDFIESLEDDRTIDFGFEELDFQDAAEGFSALIRYTTREVNYDTQSPIP